MPDAASEARNDRDPSENASALRPATPRAGADATRVSGRIGALAGLLVLQALCATFFAGDVIFDILLPDLESEDSDRHLGLEALATLALVASLVFTALEVRRLLLRQRRIERQLRAASGAFVELLDEQFDAWGLTPSERDVALLAIKGLSIAEIAAVRETREGTVKAQLGAIYAKAGVTGRPQLISLFVEALMGEGIAPVSAGAPGRTC